MKNSLPLPSLLEKKKTHPQHSHFLHGTRDLKSSDRMMVSFLVMETHRSPTEWPRRRLSTENLFSSAYYGSKTTGDIFFQFKEGWAVAQLLQLITSTEITSYQKTTRVRLWKNESRKSWNSWVQAYFWSNPVKDSIFIFFGWGISCLSWDAVQGWLGMVETRFSLPWKELTTPSPLCFEPELFRKCSTYFYLSIYIFNRYHVISRLPKNMSWHSQKWLRVNRMSL